MASQNQSVYNGQWDDPVKNGQFATYNPATDEKNTTAEDVNIAAAAAKAALNSDKWGYKSIGNLMLRKIGALVASGKGAIAQLESRDEGKPLRAATVDVGDSIWLSFQSSVSKFCVSKNATQSDRIFQTLLGNDDEGVEWMETQSIFFFILDVMKQEREYASLVDKCDGLMRKIEEREPAEYFRELLKQTKLEAQAKQWELQERCLDRENLLIIEKESNSTNLHRIAALEESLGKAEKNGRRRRGLKNTSLNASSDKENAMMTPRKQGN